MTGILLQAAAQSSPDFSFFIMMGAIFAVFYFLVMRPQRKRQQEHEALLKSADKGDEVVTAGGIHGKITGVSDDVLTVEIAALKNGERIRVKVQRTRLESVEKADGDKKPAAKGGEGS